MIYIGIDNGISGGIVGLGPCAGTAPIFAHRLPLRTVTDGTEEIDATALMGILQGQPISVEVSVFIEECPRHASSASAMRSMAISYGLIIGVLARFEHSLGWAVHRTQSGNAKAGWQRQMLGDVPKGRTKEWALAAANSIWPGATWVASPRCSKPHTGLIDAALIAEFGRRKIEGRKRLAKITT